MIDLRKLTEQKERLSNILSGEIIITPKYFGNSIIAEYNKDDYSYLKRNKEPVTIIDILVSDLYSVPIEYLKSVRENFEDGTYNFVNNYRNGKIILDARNYYEPNNFPKDDIFMASKNLFEGKLNKEQLDLFEKGYTNKVLQEFNVGSDITTIFIRSKDNPKEAFKINANNKSKSYTPSDMFNLIMVDVVRNVDVESIKKILIESDQWERVYLTVIDKIFMSYINETKYNLSSIDFGYPKHMKVNPDDKIKWLSDDVSEIIKGDNKLYDFYVMLLASFRKEQQKANVYMTDSIEGKYEEIYNTITSLCENAGINISIPSYFEHSNK